MSDENDFKDLMTILEKSEHKLPKVEYSGHLVTITSESGVMITTTENWHRQLDKAIKKLRNENNGKQNDDSV
jgi:hypothetical protein